jgi:hypothetical protein
MADPTFSHPSFTNIDLCSELIRCAIAVKWMVSLFSICAENGDRLLHMHARGVFCLRGK